MKNISLVMMVVIGLNVERFKDLIERQCNVKTVYVTQEEFDNDPDNKTKFMVGGRQFAIVHPDSGDINIKYEKNRVELYRLKDFFYTVEKKLSNENFIKKANVEVVENERKKYWQSMDKILFRMRLHFEYLANRDINERNRELEVLKLFIVHVENILIKEGLGDRIKEIMDGKE